MTSRERDQSLDTWLRKASPGPFAPTGECLDAETMAAWVDGGLSGLALEQAELHVAQCARCQTLLGAMVRADAGRATPLVERQSSWRRWLSFGVPFAAAATIVFAVAVWFSAPTPPSQSSQPAREPRERATARPPQAADRVAPPDAVAKTTESEVSRMEAREETGAPLRVLVPREQLEARSGAVANADATRAAPSANAVDVPAAPAAPAPSAALIGPDQPTRSAERTSQGLAAPRDSTGSAEFASPDRSVRWRIAGGTVQRSTDAGATWQSVATGAQAPLIAGAAPSASVCWLVGRGGVVLVTTDGNRFRRVAFPEAADLKGVEAEDASIASLTTTDGRIFSTADGGTTWSTR